MSRLDYHDFNVADVRTLIRVAKALAAPEPEPGEQVRPSAADHGRWQEWRDETTWAQWWVKEFL